MAKQDAATQRLAPFVIGDVVVRRQRHDDNNNNNNGNHYHQVVLYYISRCRRSCVVLGDIYIRALGTMIRWRQMRHSIKIQIRRARNGGPSGLVS